MIMRLIVLTIEVGAVTTIVAAAELAITKSYPNVFLYEVPCVGPYRIANIFLMCLARVAHISYANCEYTYLPT